MKLNNNGWGLGVFLAFLFFFFLMLLLAINVINNFNDRFVGLNNNLNIDLKKD